MQAEIDLHSYVREIRYAIRLSRDETDSHVVREAAAGWASALIWSYRVDDYRAVLQGRRSLSDHIRLLLAKKPDEERTE